MTVPLTGPVVLGSGGNLTTEFGLAGNAIFPTAYYGKGGAPGSGPLSFEDFRGRSNTAVATVTPNPTDGGSSSSPVVSALATCSVTGGTGPFTYVWQYVSGSAFTVNSPTAAATTFQAAMGPATTLSAVYRCQVTDTGNGSTISLSNNIDVNLERF